MTTLKLYGRNPSAVQAEAAAFLESLSGQVPEITAETDEGEKRLDPATLAVAAFAVSALSLVVSLPGAWVNVQQLRDREERRRLIDRVETLKARLTATDTEASLDLGDGAPLDLKRDPTDTIVNALTKDRG